MVIIINYKPLQSSIYFLKAIYEQIYTQLSTNYLCSKRLVQGI